jgi:hypothetical protein
MKKTGRARLNEKGGEEDNQPYKIAGRKCPEKRINNKK